LSHFRKLTLLFIALVLFVAGAAFGEQPLPQVFKISFQQRGIKRTAYVRLPQDHGQRGAMPLVLNIHGIANSAAVQEVYSGMQRATERGYVTVHPQGVEKMKVRSWNTAKLTLPGWEGIEDMSFLRALVQVLAERVPIDARRVYATGFSNGGFMAYDLAKVYPEIFAAIAPVAGLNGNAGPASSRVVPVLHVHGDGDRIVPMAGLRRPSFPGAIESVARALDSPSESKSHRPRPGLRQHDWQQGDASGSLVIVEGGGHSWPGTGLPRLARRVPLMGLDRSFDATETILDFFAANPLPERIAPGLRPSSAEVSDVRIESVDPTAGVTRFLPALLRPVFGGR
jgi:polyhydroxybutyrate depolymerase